MSSNLNNEEAAAPVVEQAENQQNDKQGNCQQNQEISDQEIEHEAGEEEMTEDYDCEGSEQFENTEEAEELERRRQARYDIMLKYLIKTKTKEELAQVQLEMTSKCAELGQRLLELTQEYE